MECVEIEALLNVIQNYDIPADIKRAVTEKLLVIKTRTEEQYQKWILLEQRLKLYQDLCTNLLDRLTEQV